ncbi:M20 family peptidase [Ktedonosporobacter rubrisoli]|uniref:M20 family peptidase n=1 Tax=Ktedonosporobacter rubrisoli TaxID=2509675 RepID=A0A4P6JXU2_KTERU|nr:M20 family metallopeptidase [Ktedonosporobacter rubrisoli]QBD80253.1 M20 family peptidase [Ktedonosporobacter rubrisoli]
MNKHQTVEQAEQIMEPFLADLQAIVNIDSGTYNKAGVDKVGAYLQQRFHDFGFSTYFDKQEEYGNHLVATHQGNNPQGPRILLIGHMDTVFPDGEVQRRPFKLTEKDGKHIAMGPGVLDMKAGLLMGMYGTRLLIDAKQANYQSLACLWNSDEEIGSPASKALIQKLAQQSDAVIVLEPGRAIDTVVSARRASGQYRVDVYGLSAHAGVEPDRGRNAIVELSHQVLAMQALHGTIPGTSLCVSVIHGGDRSNVVPDHAYCLMDVRASNMAGVHAIEAAMKQVASKTTIEGTRIEFSGEMRSLPFERSERNEPLVRFVKEVGTELGIQIRDHSTGGASDANNTSILGVPTIDGLGAGGDLAHNPDEYVELDYLPTRIALITGLLEKINNGIQS